MVQYLNFLSIEMNFLSLFSDFKLSKPIRNDLLSIGEGDEAPGREVL